jgi:hypothetical protein
MPSDYIIIPVSSKQIIKVLASPNIEQTENILNDLKI